ncbi:MAG: glycoside hydrolase family 9 protein, partial [Promethearchaeota archaeon]
MKIRFKQVWRLKFPIFIIILPVVVWFMLAVIGVSSSYSTVFDRYYYIGDESISLWGYLDLAHYRPHAIESLLSWQFFFGNLHYFIIFSLMMAGIFHSFHPRVNVQDVRDGRAFHLGNRFKKLGMVLVVIVGAIIALEMVFSVVGGTETGLGPHVFTGGYYRDIPSLVAGGFLVENSVPNDAQMPLSFLPLLSGIGFLPYFLGLKRFRNQGVYVRERKLQPTGLLLLGSGILYLIIMILRSSTTAQFVLTGYTLTMFVMWTLAALGTTGTVLLVQRAMVPAVSGLKPPRGKVAKKFFSALGIYLGFFFMIFVSVALFLMPIASRVGISEDDIEVPGGMVTTYAFLFMVVGLSSLVVFMYRRDKMKSRAYLAYFGALGSIFILIVYFLVKKFTNNIEISWLYYAIIPMVFMTVLSLVFYLAGFWMKENLEKLKGVFAARRVKTTGSTRRKRFAIADVKIAVIAVIVLGALFPFFLFNNVIKEKPVIVVNQLGMLPSQEKSFFLRMEYDRHESGTWDLINVDTGLVVNTGTLEKKGYKWKKYYWKGDFSSTVVAGNYSIRCKLGRFSAMSYPFEISPNPFDDAYRTGYYWYYHMRCGTAVEGIVPGYAGHERCHDHYPFYIENSSGSYEIRNDRNLTGGYHDSGDYNCYGHRIAPLTMALPWTYYQTPDFFNNTLNRATYPQNDNVPDIVEEMWHGVQFWKNRYHEGARKFFDSTVLGQHAEIRWTVFGAPEFEDYYGGYDGEPGRWIDDEYDPGEEPVQTMAQRFLGQFQLMNSNGPAVIAFIAAFINICDAIGWQPGNRSELVNLVTDARESYAGNIGTDYYGGGLNCELELYKLTGNNTYLENANARAASIISNFDDPADVTPNECTKLAVALDFAQRYNSTLITLANTTGTFDALWEGITNRTVESDGNNIFKYMRVGFQDAPVYQVGDIMSYIMAASYGYNMTSNATMREDFYNFITNHYDWVFGWNMENTCLLEGVPGGDKFVYRYGSH